MRRRNPHLIAMTVVGALLVVGGTILGLDGYAAVGEMKPYAAGEIGAGIGLSSLGTLLLILAWATAAARWSPR